MKLLELREQVIDSLCPEYKSYEPDPASAATYARLFPQLYFSFGANSVLPNLRRIAAQARTAQA